MKPNKKLEKYKPRKTNLLPEEIRPWTAITPPEILRAFLIQQTKDWKGWKTSHEI